MKKLLLLLLFITGTLYAQPPIAQPNDLVTCDDMSNDGIEAFDLTINETQTLNGLNPTNYTITYHLDQVGADSNSNLASPPNAFVGGPNQTIYVRVEENANPTNYAITSFNLIVNSLPSALFSPNPFVCSGEPFDLGILGTPNATVQYTIDGGSVQSIVLDATGAATLSFANLTVTTLVSMVDVSTSTCTQPFPTYEVIQVFPTPNINQPNDLTIYESPFDGSATFDLTQNEADMANGTLGLSFQYYLTLTDAQAGTNAIPNQSTFTNFTNPQTIYVRVEDNVTGCMTITDFDLVVLDSSQVIYFPDANLKAALVSASTSNTIALTSSGYGAVDTNSDGEIQYTEALAITGIQLQTLGITDLTGIEYFDNITFFGCYHNSVNNFSVLNGLQQLQNINITYNTGSVTTSNFSNLPALTNFTFTYSNVTSLVLDNLASLVNLNAWGNSNLATLNLLSLNSLDKISAFDCNILNLSITNSPVLTEINFNNNNLSSIVIQNFPLLKVLKLQGNNISDTSNFANINNIEEINIQGNVITNLILPSSLPALKYLSCGSNGFSTISILGYPSLLTLTVNNNNISNLDFSNTPLIQQLSISNNPITTIDFSNLSNLTTISCSSNTMTELDFSNNPNLMNLSYYNNPNLTNVNLKSGTINTINYNSSSYYNLPNLMYICVDEGDVFTYSLLATPPNVFVGSYCSFTPGGNYNTITGITQFDLNNNGCDVNDMLVPYVNIGVDLNATSTNSSVFSNGLGSYSLYTSQTGTFGLTPNLENPTYFNVTPNPANVNVPVIDNSITTQNFCISANGVHPDLEIVIVPITPARPGFDAVYKIVFKNKGNQTVDGFVNFTFNDAVLDFVSSSVVPNNAAGGSMNWFFPSLTPFQVGTIDLIFNVNSPTETPPVNIGDVLAFNAFIDVTTDDNWTDNNFDFNQTVVGSYDPNDITCIQGNVVAPSYIGEYLHYVINFENTGTYQAENIVVKTEINPTDFNINTLRLMEASHNVTTRIKDNVIEFIFQSINLDTGGHGNVLLKLKTNDNLLISDMVSNKADIYFDYNYPVETNFANTTFQVLSNAVVTIDKSIGIAPNPATDWLSVKANSTINSIAIYDVQGRIVQQRKATESIETLSIANLTKGIYFVMIKTALGQKVEKLVKE